MSYFYRMITGLLITCLFISACTPVTPPIPTSAPKTQPSATPLLLTKTPFPTDTVIPLQTIPTLVPSQPTPASKPTKHVPTLTPAPGPELITYLPPVKDVADKCISFEYYQIINSASLGCTIAGVGNLGIFITAKNKPVALKDIQSLAGYKSIPAPTVGQGSQVFQSTNGKTTTILFFKGNALVKISYTGFSGYLPLEMVIDEAKKVEALLPQITAPPSALSFPDKLAKDKLNDYFKTLIVSVGPSRVQGSEITLTDQVCLTEYAQKLDPRQFYQAALVDMQTNAVIRKVIYQMRYKIHCGALKPSFSANQYNVGDEYEIRIAVGDDLVAIFPLVTK